MLHTVSGFEPPDARRTSYTGGSGWTVLHASPSVPPPEKKYWRRYVYLWLNYAIYEELEAADGARARAVYRAALDVFETEPLPKTSPLWALENVIISPHCSSVYAEWEKASFEIFIKNLGRWMNGEELINIVNPNRGY